MGLKERRQRERDARREMILEAARELLQEKGLDGASMNQIARRAELGVATLYSYFTNKEDLYVALQTEGIEMLREKMRKALKGLSDPTAKLQAIARTYLTFSQRNRNYYYIINYFGSSPEIIFKPEQKRKIDQIVGGSMNLPREIIEEGIASGVFRQTNPMHAGIMFTGLIQGLTQLKKLEKTVFAEERFADIFAFAIQQFIDALRQPTPSSHNDQPL